jgi:hypothetical protein
LLPSKEQAENEWPQAFIATTNGFEPAAWISSCAGRASGDAATRPAAAADRRLATRQPDRAEARSDAAAVTADPELNAPEHAPLRQVLVQMEDTDLEMGQARGCVSSGGPVPD